MEGAVEAGIVGHWPLSINLVMYIDGADLVCGYMRGHGMAVSSELICMLQCIYEPYCL